tara:strand:- start:499 stop:972 length:474 start_codon:yes stop_codon:yes gene_type:complete
MKPKPNYWKSDTLLPSDIKKSVSKYFATLIPELIMRRTTVSYDPEEGDIVLRFNEDAFGFEFDFPEDDVSEVVNGREEVHSESWNNMMTPWGRRTNSIIYDKLLEVLNETHRREIDRYCDNIMRDMLWRFMNYLGLSNTMHYGQLDNDNIWERIHNE